MTYTIRFLRSCLVALAFLAEPAWSASCFTSSISGVGFGTYNPFLATPVDQLSTATVTCNGFAGQIIPFRVALSAGSSGTVVTCTMRRTGSVLNYNLYSDNARSAVWGNVVGTNDRSGSITVVGTSGTGNFTFFGRIPAGQTSVKAGAHTDTVTMTFTY